MTEIDIISAALCAWKENRGYGQQGMQSVINVLMNRAKAHGTSVYAEAYRPLQFSSMSYQHDPQLLIQPQPSDPQFAIANELARSAAAGTLEDITGGAQFYFAKSMDADPPFWAKKMTPTAVIGDQRFFK